jgi:hemolysin D
MKPGEKISPFPSQEARGRDEIAFLPAALEVVETPPSPAGRATAAAIIAFFCLALAWATWGEVDIVATASGKIIPSGRTKVIQPYETGVVRAINVRDGQRVKAGEVLIELDPTMSGAELGHLKSDLMAAQLDAARFRAALAERVIRLTARYRRGRPSVTRFKRRSSSCRRPSRCSRSAWTCANISTARNWVRSWYT